MTARSNRTSLARKRGQESRVPACPVQIRHMVVEVRIRVPEHGARRCPPVPLLHQGNQFMHRLLRDVAWDNWRNHTMG